MTIHIITTVITIIIALSAAATLLEFSALLAAIAAPIIAVFLHAISFYVRGVGKFQLTLGDCVQFTLNSVTRSS